MKENFRYQLDPSPRKFHCPGCGKKRFVRYVDQATGEYLPDQFGRCDREINCNYSMNPYKTGFGKNPDGTPDPIRWTPPTPEPPKPPSYIDFETFKASRTGYNQNNFVKWLLTIFDEPAANNLIARYHIGTSKHWPGATVFWQIDQAGKIRTGKIMGYNPTTGHRIKEPFPQIQWAHKALKIEPFNLKQCFFGEHLLKLELLKPVALVESEKTAVIAAGYFPNFIWLAAGSLTNISPEKCKPLAGRRVILFPDLNGFGRWKTKAAELQKAMPGTVFDISDLLENNASETERQAGLDLCDFLIKFDWQTFAGIDPPPQAKTLMENNEPGTRATDQEHKHPEPIQVESLKSEKGEKSEALKTNYFFSSQEHTPTKPTPPTMEIWPVLELEKFFAGVQLPREPIRVNRWTLITDVSKFVENQLTETRAHNGNPNFESGFERLVELKKIISQNIQEQIGNL